MATAEVTSLAWCKDPLCESRLNLHGIEFECASIRLSQIDWVASLHNGARTEEVISDAVAEYQQAMMEGKPFPCIVVEKTPTGFLVLSGVQRVSAVRNLCGDGDIEEDPEVDVYVARPKPYERHAVMVALNTMHGRGLRKEDMLQHGVTFHRQDGLSVEDAASFASVKVQALRNRLRYLDECKRYAADGIQVRDGGLTESHVRSLAKVKDLAARNKLAQVALAHTPTAESISQAALVINGEETPGGRIRQIKSYAKSLATQNGLPEEAPAATRTKTPRRDNLFKKVNSLLGFLEAGPNGKPFASLEDLQITTDEDAAQFCKASRRLIFLVRALCK